MIFMEYMFAFAHVFVLMSISSSSSDIQNCTTNLYPAGIENISCNRTDQDFLIYATYNDISLLPLIRDREAISLYSGFQTTVGIDYNQKKNYIIWSDAEAAKIYIAPLNESLGKCLLIIRIKFAIIYFLFLLDYNISIHKEPQVFLQDVSTPKGLAIDYVHDMVYWTDTGRSTIEVAKIFNPSQRLVLIKNEGHQFRSIIINVIESFLVSSNFDFMILMSRLIIICFEGFHRWRSWSQNRALSFGRFKSNRIG